ncbi:MAG: hypothetical protein HY062_11915 [Bacteroidetes bacterium]|nr:hypothetical protein [Bacteroidota bacterium]
MQEEQLKRKPRIPLSPEELYYVKKIKQLKELKKIADFKATFFYKITNRINIVLAGFLSYCVLSILICCHWQTSYISDVKCSFGEFDPLVQKRPITELEITTLSGEFIPIKTSGLYQSPQKNEVIYIGRDLLFNRVLKAKLGYDDRSFWHFYTYPIFAVIVFALAMGFFIYKVNRHLSINGLLTVFGLFVLSSIYFIMI